MHFLTYKPYLIPDSTERTCDRKKITYNELIVHAAACAIKFERCWRSIDIHTSACATGVFFVSGTGPVRIKK